MEDKPEPQPIFKGTLRQLLEDGIAEMTMRDWFAGQCLAGLSASGPFTVREIWKMVEEAYHIADAIMIQRDKPVKSLEEK